MIPFFYLEWYSIWTGLLPFSTQQFGSHYQAIMEYLQNEKSIFLDMVICKDQDVSTKLITKPCKNHSTYTCTYIQLTYIILQCSHSKIRFSKAELIRYVRLSSKLSDFLEIKHKFFNRLQDRGYPKWFLLDIFSEVHYDSCWDYPSLKKDKASMDHRLLFKTMRNPLFNNVHLKNLFLYHVGSDYDITICYKATPNCWVLVLSLFVSIWAVSIPLLSHPDDMCFTSIKSLDHNFQRISLPIQPSITACTQRLIYT